MTQREKQSEEAMDLERPNSSGANMNMKTGMEIYIVIGGQLQAIITLMHGINIA
jgi:hypothetical protein